MARSSRDSNRQSPRSLTRLSKELKPNLPKNDVAFAWFLRNLLKTEVFDFPTVWNRIPIWRVPIMKRASVRARVVALVANVGSAVADDKPGARKGRPGQPGKGNRQLVEMMFKRLDSNGDGKLSLDEFKKIGEARQGAK